MLNLKLGQKGVIHLIPLLLILAGIIGGVYLVQHPQIFKPKASAKLIEVHESSGQDAGGNPCKVYEKNGKQTTNCPEVKLKITSPEDAGLTSDAGLQLIKEVYAQTADEQTRFTGKNYQCSEDKTKVIEYVVKTPVSTTAIKSIPKIFGIPIEFKIPFLNWGITETTKTDCSTQGLVCSQTGDTIGCVAPGSTVSIPTTRPLPTPTSAPTQVPLPSPIPTSSPTSARQILKQRQQDKTAQPAAGIITNQPPAGQVIPPPPQQPKEGIGQTLVKFTRRLFNVEQPVNLTPIDDAVIFADTPQIQFSWSGPSQAKRYRWMIDSQFDKQSFTDNNCAPGLPKYKGCFEKYLDSGEFVGTRIFVPTTPLKKGIKYIWWVDALDEDGNRIGLPSNGTSFTIGTGPPTDGQPPAAPTDQGQQQAPAPVPADTAPSSDQKIVPGSYCSGNSVVRRGGKTVQLVRNCDAASVKSKCENKKDEKGVVYAECVPVSGTEAPAQPAGGQAPAVATPQVPPQAPLGNDQVGDKCGADSDKLYSNADQEISTCDEGLSCKEVRFRGVNFAGFSIGDVTKSFCFNDQGPVIETNANWECGSNQKEVREKGQGFLRSKFIPCPSGTECVQNGNKVTCVPEEQAAPTNISPKGDVNIDPKDPNLDFIDFSWSEVPDATYYRFIVDSDDDNRKSVIPGCGSNYSGYFYCVRQVKGGKFSSITFPTLAKDDTTYTWWVDAVDKDGNVISTSVGTQITIRKQAPEPTGTPTPPPLPTPRGAPVPTPAVPVKCEGELAPACRGDEFGLAASWEVTPVQGNLSCNIFIRDVEGDHRLSNKCQGEIEVFKLSKDGIESPIVSGGHYQLFVSNGSSCLNEMVDESRAALSCGDQGAPQAPAVEPPAPLPKRTTKHFRITEVAADFFNKPEEGWRDYSSNMAPITYSFRDNKPGPKVIFVQFKDDKGEIIKVKGAFFDSVSVELVEPPPPPAGGDTSTACSQFETYNVCGGGVLTYDKCTDDKGQTGSQLCSGQATDFYCEGSGNSNCISDPTKQGNYSCSACPKLAGRATPTSPLGIANCYVRPARVNIGEAVTYQVLVQGGKPPYYFNLTGDFSRNVSSQNNTTEIIQTFDSAGLKRVNLVVGSGSEQSNTFCPAVQVSSSDRSTEPPPPPPPPPPSSSACLADCKACPGVSDKCGNYVYSGSCNYSTCSSPDAEYTCVSSGNSNCAGSYRCGDACASF